MVKQKHKLVSFATIVDLWDTCSLSSAISYISAAETLTPFLAAMLRKRSYFCQKSFVPGLECSNGKIFILDYRDLGRKNRDLVNRASAVSHVTTSKLLRRKKWRATSQKPSQPGWRTCKARRLKRARGRSAK